MKKIITMIIALALVLSLGVTAFAANTYTITIGNGVDGETYYAYKVLDVTLADTDSQQEGYEAYAYSIDADSDFFKTVTGYTSGTLADTYTKWGLTFKKSANFANDNTYILIAPLTDTSDVDAAGLAAAIGAYVKANDPNHNDADGSVTYSSNTKTISVTELGYYFVDTTLGSLCSLDTTDTDVTIYEKNTCPDIEKFVKDSDTNAAFAKTADADLGETVTYKLVINTGTNTFWNNTDDSAPATGAAAPTGIDGNFVIVDTLPTGITTAAANVSITDEDNNTWTSGANNDYTVAYDSTNNKLTITLLGTASTKALCKLGQDKDITITYTATVGAAAAVNTKNRNSVKLTYKEQEDEDIADVYTWSFDILKYTEDDTTAGFSAGDMMLDGASFKLSTDAAGNNTIALVQVGSTAQDGTKTYRRALSGETGVTEITTGDSGKLVLQGFDAGTYYLTETEAPAGFNKLTAPVKVEISSAAPSGQSTETLVSSLEQDDATVTQITVENQSGIVLPSTGGMGTTIFYVVGGLMIVVALGFLAAKRRANAE